MGYPSPFAETRSPQNKPSAGGFVNNTQPPGGTSALPAAARLGHLDDARAAFALGYYREAWSKARQAIAVRPFHPEAWLFLAQAALSLGDAMVARRCAARASLMAPNWSTAQAFLGPAFPLLPSASHLDASNLFSDSEQPRLTVCLIVKNEERFLNSCLKSIQSIAAQIVVVDNGSTDRTVAIAEAHGAEIHRFAWNDDFSAARNAALEPARGDWILMLDADEELAPAGIEPLLADIRDTRLMASRLPLINAGREQEGRQYVPRLFRNVPGLYYTGRIHEQLFDKIETRRKAWGLENRLSHALLIHHGYSAEMTQSRDKVRRNLRLLEGALQDAPNDPNLLMNLGMERVRAGELQSGLEAYHRSFQSVASQANNCSPEFRETLLIQYSTHLLGAGKVDEVIQVLTSPLAQADSMSASLHFTLGLALARRGLWEQCVTHMLACLSCRAEATLSTVNPEIFKSAPHHCLALALARLGRREEARQAFADGFQAEPQSRLLRLDHALFQHQTGFPVDALQSLNALVAEDPKDPRPWRSGGEIALGRKEYLEFALDWTSEAVNSVPDDQVLQTQRATALLLAGQLVEALECWKPLAASGDIKAVAALILGQLASGQRYDIPPVSRITERRTSEEFLNWYRKLAHYNSEMVIRNINCRLETLALLLPSAVMGIKAALASADAAE